MSVGSMATWAKPGNQPHSRQSW